MFGSILFGDSRPAGAQDCREQPAFFRDLNLDQVTAAVTAGYGGYDLAPFFYAPLTSVDLISYRHEVFTDLGDAGLLALISEFTAAMARMREQLASGRTLHYQRQRQRWFLEAAATYCAAVTSLAGGLREAAPASRGLVGLREFLAGYTSSEAFTALVSQATALQDDLAGVAYTLQIKGNRIRVRRYDQEADYGVQVLATFEKFRQGADRDYRVRMPIRQNMNHVEAGVLDLVARLHPGPFAALDRFCESYQDFLDGTIARFDREVQFYLAYLAYLRPIEAAGLPFCYPQVSADGDQVRAEQAFDLALAAKCTAQGAPVVTNDFWLDAGERILVVTGPNQGGKTTFARAFGQLHHLARLGCPVPGRAVALRACDDVFTHFEQEEDLANLSGKLHDDLLRFRDILDRATGSSVIIMNEIFSSTTVADALFLGKHMLARVASLGALAVCVTFLDELASLDPTCVSMVATVAPDDPAQRTFRVVRRPADGLAYATALAARYGLTYDQLKERLAS